MSEKPPTEGWMGHGRWSGDGEPERDWDSLRTLFDLAEPFDSGPEEVQIKVTDGRTVTPWIRLPSQAFSDMLANVRGLRGVDLKAFPREILRGRVAASLSLPAKPGKAPHRGVVIREYGQYVNGRTGPLYSVHTLHADDFTEPWRADEGKCDLSWEEAIREFARRAQEA